MNFRNLSGALPVLLIIMVPIFGHLSELPIQRWDESRLATAAYEMSETHNWLIPTFDWLPDMASVKPPLAIWLMILSMKLFGVNELAIRIPSALAAVGTCLFMYWFLAVKLKKSITGIIAPAILIVSGGYVRLHGIRTGDFDPLLTMFTTMFLCYYFLYLDDKGRRYLICTAITLTLACLTKGVAALMFMPGLLIITLLQKRLKPLLLTREFYIGAGIFILFVPGYYLLREHYNPGYLEAVSQNDLGGRFLKTMEQHKEKWSFYLQYLYLAGPVWLLLSLWGMQMGITAQTSQIKMLVRHLSIAVCTFIIVISLAATKLDWYTMPVFPLLAILAALAIQQIFSIVQKQSRINIYVKYLLPLLVFGLVYYSSYSRILQTVLHPQTDVYNADNPLIAYLHQGSAGKRNIDSTIVVYAEFAQDIYWYVNTDKRLTLESIHKLDAGDKVAVNRPESLEIIEAEYETDVTIPINGVHVYKILKRKPAYAILN